MEVPATNEVEPLEEVTVVMPAEGTCCTYMYTCAQLTTVHVFRYNTLQLKNFCEKVQNKFNSWIFFNIHVHVR